METEDLKEKSQMLVENMAWLSYVSVKSLRFPYFSTVVEACFNTVTQKAGQKRHTVSLKELFSMTKRKSVCPTSKTKNTTKVQK